MNGEHGPEAERQELSPRDEALRCMVVGGWADQITTSLSTTAARISNGEAELSELVDAFSDDFSRAGLTAYGQLVGHFLIVEHEDVFAVTTYPTESRLIAAFEAVRRRLAEAGDE